MGASPTSSGSPPCLRSHGCWHPVLPAGVTSGIGGFIATITNGKVTEPDMFTLHLAGVDFAKNMMIALQCYVGTQMDSKAQKLLAWTMVAMCAMVTPNLFIIRSLRSPEAFLRCSISRSCLPRTSPPSRAAARASRRRPPRLPRAVRVARLRKHEIEVWGKHAFRATRPPSPSSRRPSWECSSTRRSSRSRPPQKR